MSMTVVSYRTDMMRSASTARKGAGSQNQQPSMRIESDSIGMKEVPYDALYGVQSLRAYENFPMTGLSLHPEMIRSLAKVKKACALSNRRAGTLPREKADAIISACDEIMDGKYHDAFIVDPIQGGAGTSMNMNTNEVIANLAIEKLGGHPGDYKIVHPNDDVNMGQSTNDVIPTAGKITVLELLKPLDHALVRLHSALLEKAEEFDGIIKMGRTQLQDAVPIRLGQEFHAYGEAVERGLHRIRQASSEMHAVNLGGTAIGTAVNADPDYYYSVISSLSKVTGFRFSRCADMIDGTQSIDSFAAVSSAVKNCAVALSKICNDLRLLSSGPRTGLEEISLPPMQNGSSIMPGKVNPVIPEVVSQAAFLCMGMDVTVEMAAEAGQLELNAFEPIAFYALFQEIDVLAHAVETLTVNCVEGITADKKHCRDLLEGSVGIVTALNPYIGYTRSAHLAKEALKENIPVRRLAVMWHVMTDEQITRITDPYKMTEPPEKKK